MKKVLLTAMTLISIATSSVFGYYGDNSDWIDFLADGNQFRARMDKIGFVLGNGTIKGTFGFKGNTAGVILDATTGNANKENNNTVLKPVVSAGIGYTTEAFGIGVGYNFTYINKSLQVHTPVLAINALNNNFRLAVPVQVAVSDNPKGAPSSAVNYKKYMGISLDPQIRYYTGIDALSQLRLIVRYGMLSYKDSLNKEQEASSLGVEFRIDFLKSMVGNVEVAPFFRVKYNTALSGKSTEVKAGSGTIGVAKGSKNERNPFDLSFELPVGLGASSDTVSLYLEPRLGYAITSEGTMNNSPMNHKLTWGAYGEIYIRPVQDLEWYFEADVGNYKVNAEDLLPPDVEVSVGNAVNFAASTGITWYLPSFNGAE